ncbi:hypothetical protein HCN44_004652 [Aphidius gifuensis]|uniref:Uncharacterized protein n=1 Tax=Aphidius gifuensis TaxID=684658 RepID=A0A835CW85_APHGI|nr:hypothetical protein HCN44_004652 [Aphidius gifuensis]
MSMETANLSPTEWFENVIGSEIGSSEKSSTIISTIPQNILHKLANDNGAVDSSNVIESQIDLKTHTTVSSMLDKYFIDSKGHLSVPRELELENYKNDLKTYLIHQQNHQKNINENDLVTELSLGIIKLNANLNLQQEKISKIMEDLAKEKKNYKILFDAKTLLDNKLSTLLLGNEGSNYQLSQFNDITCQQISCQDKEQTQTLAECSELNKKYIKSLENLITCGNRVLSLTDHQCNLEKNLTALELKIHEQNQQYSNISLQVGEMFLKNMIVKNPSMVPANSVAVIFTLTIACSFINLGSSEKNSKIISTSAQNILQNDYGAVDSSNVIKSQIDLKTHTTVSSILDKYFIDLKGHPGVPRELELENYKNDLKTHLIHQQNRQKNINENDLVTELSLGVIKLNTNLNLQQEKISKIMEDLAKENKNYKILFDAKTLLDNKLSTLLLGNEGSNYQLSQFNDITCQQISCQDKEQTQTLAEYSELNKKYVKSLENLITCGNRVLSLTDHQWNLEKNLTALELKYHEQNQQYSNISLQVGEMFLKNMIVKNPSMVPANSVQLLSSCRMPYNQMASEIDTTLPPIEKINSTISTSQLNESSEVDEDYESLNPDNHDKENNLEKQKKATENFHQGTQEKDYKILFDAKTLLENKLSASLLENNELNNKLLQLNNTLKKINQDKEQTLAEYSKINKKYTKSLEALLTCENRVSSLTDHQVNLEKNLTILELKIKNKTDEVDRLKNEQSNELQINQIKQLKAIENEYQSNLTNKQPEVKTLEEILFGISEKERVESADLLKILMFIMKFNEDNVPDNLLEKRQQLFEKKYNERQTVCVAELSPKNMGVKNPLIMQANLVAGIFMLIAACSLVVSGSSEINSSTTMTIPPNIQNKPSNDNGTVGPLSLIQTQIELKIHTAISVILDKYFIDEFNNKLLQLNDTLEQVNQEKSLAEYSEITKKYIKSLESLVTCGNRVLSLIDHQVNLEKNLTILELEIEDIRKNNTKIEMKNVTDNKLQSMICSTNQQHSNISLESLEKKSDENNKTIEESIIALQEERTEKLKAIENEYQLNLTNKQQEMLKGIIFEMSQRDLYGSTDLLNTLISIMGFNEDNVPDNLLKKRRQLFKRRYNENQTVVVDYLRRCVAELSFKNMGVLLMMQANLVAGIFMLIIACSPVVSGSSEINSPTTSTVAPNIPNKSSIDNDDVGSWDVFQNQIELQIYMAISFMLDKYFVDEFNNKFWQIYKTLKQVNQEIEQTLDKCSETLITCGNRFLSVLDQQVNLEKKPTILELEMKNNVDNKLESMICSKNQQYSNISLELEKKIDENKQLIEESIALKKQQAEELKATENEYQLNLTNEQQELEILKELFFEINHQDLVESAELLKTLISIMKFNEYNCIAELSLKNMGVLLMMRANLVAGIFMLIVACSPVVSGSSEINPPTTSTFAPNIPNKSSIDNDDVGSWDVFQNQKQQAEELKATENEYQLNLTNEQQELEIVKELFFKINHQDLVESADLLKTLISIMKFNEYNVPDNLLCVAELSFKNMGVLLMMRANLVAGIFMLIVACSPVVSGLSEINPPTTSTFAPNIPNKSSIDNDDVGSWDVFQNQIELQIYMAISLMLDKYFVDEFDNKFWKMYNTLKQDNQEMEQTLDECSETLITCGNRFQSLIDQQVNLEKNSTILELEMKNIIDNKLQSMICSNLSLELEKKIDENKQLIEESIALKKEHAEELKAIADKYQLNLTNTQQELEIFNEIIFEDLSESADLLKTLTAIMESNEYNIPDDLLEKRRKLFELNYDEKQIAGSTEKNSKIISTSAQSILPKLTNDNGAVDLSNVAESQIDLKAHTTVSSISDKYFSDLKGHLSVPLELELENYNNDLETHLIHEQNDKNDLVTGLSLRIMELDSKLKQQKENYKTLLDTKTLRDNKLSQRNDTCKQISCQDKKQEQKTSSSEMDSPTISTTAPNIPNKLSDDYGTLDSSDVNQNQIDQKTHLIAESYVLESEDDKNGLETQLVKKENYEIPFDAKTLLDNKLSASLFENNGLDNKLLQLNDTLNKINQNKDQTLANFSEIKKYTKSLETSINDHQVNLEKNLTLLQLKIKDIIDENNNTKIEMKNIIDNLQSVILSKNQQYSNISLELEKKIEENNKIIQESIALKRKQAEKLKAIENDYQLNLKNKQQEVKILQKIIFNISQKDLVESADLLETLISIMKFNEDNVPDDLLEKRRRLFEHNYDENETVVVNYLRKQFDDIALSSDSKYFI